MIKKPEILAPVGGKEQLTAAVRMGADAVYLGGKGFNARHNAENFDSDSLLSAVKYCHSRGVAVYATLNTLFLDNELEKLLEEIELFASCGVDALIVQDLGVARIVREIYPSIALHASTQMSVHNVAGAQELKKLGFTRIVPARELTADEIAVIKRETGLEIEVFVHGALCMCFSGNCYLSAVLGGRSGNRGMCAQPCRLDFKNNYGREYALSLKDLSLVEKISQLAEIGVDSLKIEGRMKRPEYVAAAVKACNEAINDETPDMQRLQAVFSRSGFTDGYFANKRTVDMFGYRREEDVQASATVLGDIATEYRNENPRTPVDVTVKIIAGAPVSMQMIAENVTVAVQGEAPQNAINRPTDEELVRRGVEKLGGTSLYLRDLQVEIGEGLALPLSAINKMRKECAEKILKQREQVHPHEYHEPKLPLGTHPKKLSLIQPQLRLRFATIKQMGTHTHGGMIILPIAEILANVDIISTLGERLIAELPQFVFHNQESELLKQITELKECGLQSVIAGSLGAVAIAKQASVNVYGDFALNVVNSHSLQEYRDIGLCDMTISYESTLNSARRLGDYLPYGLIGYGNLPLMYFRNCPAQGASGCGSCGGKTDIIDRKGIRFPIICTQRRYSSMLNPIALYMGDRQRELDGFAHITLYFTTETSQRCGDVIKLWQGGSPYDTNCTRGLYSKGWV